MVELLHKYELWGEASVHAKNFIVDQGSNRHAVKNVLELLPDSNAVAPLAFVVKPINAIDLPALMVAAQ